jgi:hypothetical protein
VEFSSDFQPVREIPFSVPQSCSLFDVFPAPVGKFLLIELSCPNGQTVLFLDSETGSVTQPVSESDSHFLAWANDSKSAYLKIDSLGDARVVRAHTNGRYQNTGINNWTYDLVTNPNSDDFVFTFSRGMGYGSEMTLSQHNGRDLQQLVVDRYHYLSLARYSPDGKQISFIKIPVPSLTFSEIPPTFVVIGITPGKLGPRKFAFTIPPIGTVSGTIVDTCSGHGTFLDRGELHQVVTFILDGGLSRMRQAELERLKEETRRLRELEMHLRGNRGGQN